MGGFRYMRRSTITSAESHLFDPNRWGRDLQRLFNFKRFSPHYLQLQNLRNLRNWLNFSAYMLALGTRSLVLATRELALATWSTGFRYTLPCVMYMPTGVRYTLGMRRLVALARGGPGGAKEPTVMYLKPARLDLPCPMNAGACIRHQMLATIIALILHPPCM
jgi:hypothetical protein